MIDQAILDTLTDDDLHDDALRKAAIESHHERDTPAEKKAAKLVKGVEKQEQAIADIEAEAHDLDLAAQVLLSDKSMSAREIGTEHVKIEDQIAALTIAIQVEQRRLNKLLTEAAAIKPELEADYEQRKADVNSHNRDYGFVRSEHQLTMPRWNRYDSEISALARRHERETGQDKVTTTGIPSGDKVVIFYDSYRASVYLAIPEYQLSDMRINGKGPGYTRSENGCARYTQQALDDWKERKTPKQDRVNTRPR